MWLPLGGSHIPKWVKLNRLTTLRVESTTICQTESSVRPRQSPRSDSSIPTLRADSPRPIRDSVNSHYQPDQFQLVEHPGPTLTPTTGRKPNWLGGTPSTRRCLSISKSTSPTLTDKTPPFVFSRTRSSMPTAQSPAIQASSLQYQAINSCSRTNRVNYWHFLKHQKIRRSSPTWTALFFTSMQQQATLNKWQFLCAIKCPVKFCLLPIRNVAAK